MRIKNTSNIDNEKILLLYLIYVLVFHNYFVDILNINF